MALKVERKKPFALAAPSGNGLSRHSMVAQPITALLQTSSVNVAREMDDGIYAMPGLKDLAYYWVFSKYAWVVSENHIGKVYCTGIWSVSAVEAWAREYADTMCHWEWSR